MTLKPSDLVNQVNRLASLPDICFQINKLSDDPRASTNDFKKVIESDPALSANLLRIANSSFYGQGRPVDDLNRAILLIGTQGLRDIAWSSVAMKTFSRLSSDLVDMYAYWRHSLLVGIIARLLANKCQVLHRDRMFLAGLFHDIGRLLMYQLIPDKMTDVYQRMNSRGEPSFVAEKSVLGFNHAKVGELLLKSWHLPESLYYSVAFHHQPGIPEKHRLESAILHLADAFAKKAGIPGHKVQENANIDMNAWKITALSDKIMVSVIDLSKQQLEEVEHIYLKPLNLQPAA